MSASNTKNKKSNTSKKTTSKKTTAKKSTSSKTNTSKKQTASKSSASNEHVEVNKTIVDIVLVVAALICVFFFASNLGFGGPIGKNISDFFFGIFGLVNYIMPFVLFIIVFLGCVYYVMDFTKELWAAVICGVLFILFLTAFFELINNGDAVLVGRDAFESSKLTHLGGGLIGGFFASTLFKSFGLIGAYVASIIVMIICGFIIYKLYMKNNISKTSKMEKSHDWVQNQRRKQAIKRKDEKIQRRIERDREIERLENENTEGPRTSRRHSGVTSNLEILPTNEASRSRSTDNMSEVLPPMFGSENGSLVSSGVNYSEPVASRVVSSVAPKEEQSVLSPKKTAPVIRTSANTRQVEPKVENNNVVVTNPVQMEIEDVVIPQKTLTPANTASSSTQMPVQKEQPKKDVPVEEIKIKTTSSTKNKNYKAPSTSLLKQAPKTAADSSNHLLEMSEKLENTLRIFGVEAQVVEVVQGPAVTRFEIQPAQGTKVSKIVNLSDDIKLNLAVTDVRIEAPVPGKSVVGIEVPNANKQMVSFKELVESPAYKNKKSNIAFAVGKNLTGDVVIANIEKMPHLLIAGTTGSGKSVCINTIIMSIIYGASPDDVKLMMIDPKVVELSVYNGIPHLLAPVCTEPNKAASLLHAAVQEMDRRYQELANAGVRDIHSYNTKIKDGTMTEVIDGVETQVVKEKMPQLVIVIDEMADLMMTAAKDVEASICRIAQLARAAGIHLILATQRPTVDVITGLIKANVPSRIAFKVSSATDSRVILDTGGAEDLLGYGDMLYFPQGQNQPERIQGAYIDEAEVASVVEDVKRRYSDTRYDEEMVKSINAGPSITTSAGGNGGDDDKDPLFADCGRLIIENEKASIGYLQRNFRIGFNRAARIMDQLCDYGVVGPEIGTKPRTIQMTLEEFEALINSL